MDAEHWRQVRVLFDAVCELPSEDWPQALQDLTSDPGLRSDTLELLRSQTVDLGRARVPLSELIGRVADPEMSVGDTIGHWRLTGHLASGGMGVVFLAERADGLYQQRVAIKLLHGMLAPETARRLAEERRILAALQHPNIARLYDGGSTPAGQPYLVMEYIEGEPLDAWCERHAPDLQQRLRLFIGICRGVQAAHARLVVHCDLKPGNVMVDGDVRPILLDFGIARLLDPDNDAQRGDFCTPAYAAPELLAGGSIGVQLDVFSLGVILTELVSGSRVGRTSDSKDKPVPRPSELAADTLPWKRRLRGDIDAIAAKACALDPAARYTSVEALANDIERYFTHSPVSARAPSVRYRAGRFLRQRWRESAVAAVIMALSLVFVWRLADARSQAEREAEIARQVSDFLVSTFEAADPRLRGGQAAETVTARELLDAGSARIEEELRDSPVVRARLQGVFGLAYHNIGMDRRAEELMRTSAEELIAAGPEHIDQASHLLNELSTLLANLGRGEESERVARRSLALLEGHDQAGFRVPQAWNSLGLALMEQQRFDEAESAFLQSLWLRRDDLATLNQRATVMGNLGLLYRRQGNFGRSLDILRQALDIKRSELGESSTEYVHVLLSLATTTAALGEYARAADLFESALPLSIEVNGAQSQSVAEIHNNLAGVYQDLGDLGAGAAHYQEALAIAAGTSGEASLDYMTKLNNLATLEETRGDIAAAESMFRRSLEFRRGQFGPDHASSLRAEMNLARLLMRDGRLREAEPMLRRAIDAWARQLDDTAIDMIVSRIGWAEFCVLAGRFDEARRTLDGLVPESGWPSPATRLRHQSIEAELLQRIGNPAEAVAAWGEVLALSDQVYGRDSINSARWRVSLAESLLLAGRPGPAGLEARSAESLLRAQLVPDAGPLKRLDAVLRAASG